jgi:peptide/nickel transport system permease protein
MSQYLFRRLLQVIIILLLVTILIFGAMHFLPGGPLLLFFNQYGLTQLTQQNLDHFIHQYGLDKPLVVQYVDWLKNLAHGEFGTSIVSHKKVSTLLAQSLPITLHLGILAAIISTFLGVLSGTVAAVRRGTWLDTIVTFFSNIGQTVPIFWLGILGIFVFGLSLHWLPLSGYTSPFTNFGLSVRQIIMPVACLCVIPLSYFSRQTRSSVLEVVRQDYVRTAFSKGLRERVVILKHVLKNSLIPVITLIGIQVPMIFGGEVLIETVFNIPGLGRLTVNAILGQDLSIVMACCLIISAMAVFSNLAVDISYAFIDPRIRYE